MKKNLFVFKYILGLVLFLVSNRIEVRYLLPIRSIVVLSEKSKVISLRLMGATIGSDSYLRSNLFIVSPKRLFIGEGSKIGPNSEIWNYDSFIVGDNVEIGSRLIVHTDEHKFRCKDLPLAKQGSDLLAVVVEDDVYIGSNVTLLSGVKVSSRVIVAAGSVVTKNLDTGFIYGGVPARKISKI